MNEGEISAAISNVKSGEAPGPDGLPIDIYKNLLPNWHNFLDMLSESFQKGILPSTLRGALITLLPKLGKPIDRCKNMWPINPLWPLLFLIAIEPFAIAARDHMLIAGIKIERLNHHIALYANDVILFLKSWKNLFRPFWI